MILSPLYKGSVKDLLGPYDCQGSRAVVFRYSDAFSVFDWGRMPDAIPSKGAALAVTAAGVFERLQDPKTWQDFSKTPQALALRKDVPAGLGGPFNEIGERLQRNGLKTHYLGMISGENFAAPLLSSSASRPEHQLAVKQVNVVRPKTVLVAGRELYDYADTRAATAPKLVPLEVVFRFSLPEGSSFLKRLESNPQALSELLIPRPRLEKTGHWEFPALEFFTKLESTDRLLTPMEALSISGLTSRQLEALAFQTVWVAGLLKSWLADAGLELADGKLEWALDRDGDLVLVDAIGPDELRILHPGKKAPLQFSKEFLRIQYRKSEWFADLKAAQSKAARDGISDWKKLMASQPTALEPRAVEAASQIYKVLARVLTGRDWFPGTWTVAELAARIEELS